MDYLVDKKDNNQTEYINNLIREASKSNGRVIFKENETYICGSIILEDNVTLILEKNSKIIASKNLNDYILISDVNLSRKLPSTFEDCTYNGLPAKCFIYAKSKNNISIVGEGVIDGSEEIYYGKTSEYQIEGYFYPRIPVIFFEDCKNINISGITIKRSGFWTIHLVGVDTGLIENITIDNNLKMANCDGIDPDHSKNLIIRNCNISCADDCIVFKNTRFNKCYGSCENILVENCNLTSTSACVKVGTESVSDFKNINIKNINITSSNRGISIQLRDEGNISNLNFENVTIDTRRFNELMWWGSSEPISITAVKREESSVLGNINNINFKNITASSETGILLYSNVKNISDINFNNINLKLTKKSKYKYKGKDLRPTYNNQIVKDNNYVIYTKNIDNLSILNFNYSIDNSIRDEFNEDYKFVDTNIKKCEIN